MNEPNTMRILGREDSDETRGVLSQTFEEMRFKVTEISTQALKDRLGEFLKEMNGIVQELPSKLGEFKLEEISISVEVSASGNVSLLGSGAQVEGKGGLTFILKRD